MTYHTGKGPSDVVERSFGRGIADGHLAATHCHGRRDVDDAATGGHVWHHGINHVERTVDVCAERLLNFFSFEVVEHVDEAARTSIVNFYFVYSTLVLFLMETEWGQRML